MSWKDKWVVCEHPNHDKKWDQSGQQKGWECRNCGYSVCQYCMSKNYTACPKCGAK